MRILFLSAWYPYLPDNGSKLRVYNLLQALTNRHQVTLLSFAFDTAQPDKTDTLQSFCHDVRGVALDPFEVNRASTLRTFLSLRPLASRPIPAMRDLAAATLRAQRFDAVVASTEVMMDYALLAAPGAARILEEHNSMTRWARERYEGARGSLQRARCWASWRKGRWYEARAYRRFDLVTMVSAQDKQATLDCVGAGRVRVEVVPNGVDCAHNRPGLAAAQPGRLVYNGSLTYDANYDAMRWFLAEVYPRIRAQSPGVSLTITGSTAGVNLAGLALDDTVRLTGFVDDVRQPVASAAVCVAPIRQGGGTRLKILEAMALGTPVVATAKGAEGLDVVDGEHLLLADDPERFARHVASLLHSPPLREHLAANARRLVETHYDWRQIGSRFVSLVKEVALQRASAASSRTSA